MDKDDATADEKEAEEEGDVGDSVAMVVGVFMMTMMVMMMMVTMMVMMMMLKTMIRMTTTGLTMVMTILMTGRRW